MTIGKPFLCLVQVAKLEQQLSMLMQSMPADVSITPKGSAPLTPLTMQGSPSLAKISRRRSAFELVSPLCVEGFSPCM